MIVSSGNTTPGEWALRLKIFNNKATFSAEETRIPGSFGEWTAHATYYAGLIILL